MNPFDCPRCRSGNTQSFENIYSQNVRQSYGVNGRYDSWNQLAVQTAPPDNPHIGCGSIFLIFLLTFFISVITATVLSISLESPGNSMTLDTRATIVLWVTFLVFILTFVGGFVVVSGRIKKRMPDYRKRLAEWNKSMLCRRCGYAWLRET